MSDGNGGRQDRHGARWLLAMLVILAALGVFAYPWLEPAALVHSIRGVDVSHHQGAIDWRALAGDGVRFAYMKATEGGDFRDPRFEENWREARATGVPRGAYHFFTLCRPGAEQADNFIAAVPREAGALPPVIDAEHMGPCQSGPMIGDVPAEITVFLDRVERHYRSRPLIYTTREFHDAHLRGGFAGERFWARSLVLRPSFRTGEWVIWQYHNYGRRAGVEGPVDLNAFAGSEAAFERFRSGR